MSSSGRTTTTATMARVTPARGPPTWRIRRPLLSPTSSANPESTRNAPANPRAERRRLVLSAATIGPRFTPLPGRTKSQPCTYIEYSAVKHSTPHTGQPDTLGNFRRSPDDDGLPYVPALHGRHPHGSTDRSPSHRPPPRRPSPGTLDVLLRHSLVPVPRRRGSPTGSKQPAFPVRSPATGSATTLISAMTHFVPLPGDPGCTAFMHLARFRGR
jgi:hypothetical protein